MMVIVLERKKTKKWFTLCINIYLFLKHKQHSALCYCFTEFHIRQYVLEKATQQELLLWNLSMISVIILLFSMCWPMSARGVYRACVYRPLVCMTSDAKLQTTQACIHREWRERERWQWDERPWLLREKGQRGKEDRRRGTGCFKFSRDKRMKTWRFHSSVPICLSQEGERYYFEDVLGCQV